MRRIYTTLALALLLMAAPVMAQSDGCTRQTMQIGISGKMRTCTTCCYSGICNTTCVSN